ncbi:MAG: TetR/AcrR family transcriptional regulator [Myxococcota bacterium]
MKKNSRTERAHATRNAILDAATLAFAKDGFHAVGLRSIARTVGISQPLIHRHFGSKDALFDEVLRRSAERYDDVLAAHWAREPSDVRFFTQGLRTFFDWLGEHLLEGRLESWARLQGCLPQLSETTEMMAKLRQRFVDAQRAGVIKPQIDVDATLLVVNSLFKGFWERADDFPDIDRAGSRVFRQALDFLLPGMLTDRALREALEDLATDPPPSAASTE